MKQHIDKISKWVEGKNIVSMYKTLTKMGYDLNLRKSIIKEITGIDIITFEDLEFNPHPVVSINDPHAIQAHGKINSKTYSIVQGEGMYGDRITNTYEVFNNDVMEEPEGWLDTEEVTHKLLELYED